MGKKIKKRVKNSPKWKQSLASHKRRSGKTGGYFGIGRYVIGFLAFALVYQFAVRPSARRIMSHPIFEVRHVVVRGSRYIDSEEMIAKAAVDVGANIFEIDIGKISGNLKDVYAAEDFTVYRSMPGTIAIKVHEKIPVALLNTKKLIGVDKNGVPLPHIGADLVETLPIVTGINSIADLSDSTVKARLLAGLNMLEKIKKKAPSTYKRISEINVSNLNTMGISLIDNGLEVIIGDKDWTRKLPVLDRVINEVTSRRKAVKAVDIRFGEVVVIKK